MTTNLTDYYITFKQTQSVSTRLFSIYRCTLERQDFETHKEYFDLHALHSDFYNVFECEKSIIIKHKSPDQIHEYKAMQRLLDNIQDMISTVKYFANSEFINELMMLDYQILIIRRDMHTDSRVLENLGATVIKTLSATKKPLRKPTKTRK